MFALTLTGGELASVYIIATALQKARKSLLKKELLDASDPEVHADDDAIASVIQFTKESFPLYLTDTDDEVYEMELAVDTQTLPFLIRILQKANDSTGSIMVNAFQQLTQARTEEDPDTEKMAAQYYEDMNFFLILKNALIRTITTLTSTDDHLELLH